jgi:hypothetical protein
MGGEVRRGIVREQASGWALMIFKREACKPPKKTLLTPDLELIAVAPGSAYLCHFGMGFRGTAPQRITTQTDRN